MMMTKLVLLVHKEMFLSIKVSLLEIQIDRRLASCRV
jgi:hypothetical protein